MWCRVVYFIAEDDVRYSGRVPLSLWWLAVEWQRFGEYTMGVMCWVERGVG